MSKLLERLVARQLIDYLTAFKLLPELQSAYRAHHSTETAVLKVLGDILRAVDTGDLAVLTLLDLSAAFDTVDHATLLRRLCLSYELGGAVIDWFTSYFDGRTQHVRNQSKILPVLFEKSHSSVFSTCRRRLTVSITLSCSSVYKLRSASEALRSTGFDRFSADAPSRSCTAASNRLRRKCFSAFRRAQCSDRCHTCSTQHLCPTSSRDIRSICINTLTIYSCICACHRRKLRSLLTASLRVLLMLKPG